MVERHSILTGNRGSRHSQPPSAPHCFFPCPPSPKTAGWLGVCIALRQAWNKDGDKEGEDHRVGPEGAAVAGHPLAGPLTHPAPAWLFLTLSDTTWQEAEV